MSDEHQIEAAITAYRKQLEAEVEIGTSDLAEIEDHLRELVRELRETGMPIGAAITEAAQRLGEPAALAREHARVRSAFGVKLSPARAWSATVLVVAQLVLGVAQFPGPLIFAFLVTSIVLPAIVAIGLAARLTWARALILGMSGYILVDQLLYILLLRSEFPGGSETVTAALTVMSAGTLAFVIPWRRGEITQAGVALVSLFAAFAGAISLSAVVITGPLELVILSHLALSVTVVSGCGIVLRARWAALTAAAASALLVASATQLADLGFFVLDATTIRVLVPIVLGAAAAAVTAVLSWRTARTRLGTFRSILS